MARILTVISGNGGMGKSFLSCNLAYGFKSMGRSVLLVEAASGVRTDDVVLGISPDTQFTLYDICKGLCTVDEAVTSPEDDSLPDFISASPKLCDFPCDDGIKKIADYADGRYDFVIFDTSSDNISLCAAAVSDTILALTDISFISVRNTALKTNHIRNVSDGNLYTVINNIRPDTYSDAFVEDIIDEIGAALAGIIPYDEFVSDSLLLGDLIYKYNTYAGRAVENICKRILGESVPDYIQRVKSGFFSKNKLVLK